MTVVRPIGIWNVSKQITDEASKRQPRHSVDQNKYYGINMAKNLHNSTACVTHDFFFRTRTTLNEYKSMECYHKNIHEKIDIRKYLQQRKNMGNTRTTQNIALNLNIHFYADLPVISCCFFALFIVRSRPI